MKNRYLKNERGGVLIPVISMSVLTLMVGLFFFRQTENMVSRGHYSSLQSQREVSFNSEMKYIISTPNCGIVDLDSGGLGASSGKTYSISQGLRSDIQTEGTIYRRGAPFLRLMIQDLFIAEFDSKLYLDFFEADSLEGLGLKKEMSTIKQFIPLAAENTFLASLNVVTSMERTGRKGTFLSAFPVVVRIENGEVTACRGVSQVVKVREMCDLYGGSWDESLLICQTLAKTASSGEVEHCAFNESCWADAQFKF